MHLEREYAELLYCLIAENDWVSGNDLSAASSLKNRRIQQDIPVINDKIHKYGVIESRRNKGYKIFFKSETARDDMIQLLITDSDNDSRLNEKTVLIIMLLLFANEPMAMDRIAEQLYLSKTSVFDAMQNIRRWFSRIDDLEIEISPVKGCSICGKELSKRYFCANLLSDDIFNQLDLPEGMDVLYHQALEEAEQKVENQNISGEKVSLYCRFAGISAVREAMGFALEPGEDISPDLFLGHAVSTQAKSDRDKIENALAQKLKMSKEQLFSSSQQIPDFLFEQSSVKEHSVNHYDKDIIRHCLLEIHLVDQVFRECLGWVPARSDLLLLAYRLACSLRALKYRSSVKVLLVANQDILILDGMKEIILSLLPFKPAVFQWMTVHEYQENSSALKVEYDLFFTTDRALTMISHEFCVIPCIIHSQNLLQCSENISNSCRQFELMKLDQLISNAEKVTFDSLAGITDLLTAEEYPHCTPVTVDRKTLCLILPSDEKRLTIVSLGKELKAGGHEFKRILIVHYVAGDPDLFLFFHLISMLLNQ